MSLFNNFVKQIKSSVDDVEFLTRIKENDDYNNIDYNTMFNELATDSFAQSVISDEIKRKLYHGDKNKFIVTNKGNISEYQAFKDLLHIYYYLLYKIIKDDDRIYTEYTDEQKREEIKRIEDKIKGAIDSYENDYAEFTKDEIKQNKDIFNEDREDDDLEADILTDKELFEDFNDIPKLYDYWDKTEEKNKFLEKDFFNNYNIDKLKSLFSIDNGIALRKFAYNNLYNYLISLGLPQRYLSNISVVISKIQDFASSIVALVKNNTFNSEAFNKLFNQTIESIVSNLYLIDVSSYYKTEKPKGKNISNIQNIHSDGISKTDEEIYNTAVTFETVDQDGSKIRLYNEDAFNRAMNIVIEFIKKGKSPVTTEIIELKDKAEKDKLKRIIIPQNLKRSLNFNCLEFLEPMYYYFNKIFGILKILSERNTNYYNLSDKFITYNLKLKDNIKYLKSVVNSDNDSYIDINDLDVIYKNYLDAIKNSKLCLDLSKSLEGMITGNFKSSNTISENLKNTKYLKDLF